MILCKSPLRISLGGGGTDMPAYYNEYGGFLIAGAIQKYVYVSLTKPFYKGIYLQYSKQEQSPDVAGVQHPIIRESLNIFAPEENQLELASLADIPAGTGLGSSGSFTTALLKAISLYYNQIIKTDELAELACHIELDLLKEPAGKQDQYIAAFGGLTSFTFNKDGTTEVKALNMDDRAISDLQHRLLMYYTGISQRSGIILQDQKERATANDSAMIENLHFIKDLGYKSRDLLEGGDLWGFGKVMHEHWLKKRQRSKGMTNEKIDAIYNTGINNGAVGGKLIGAGGRGFVMFLAEDRPRLQKAMRDLGLQEIEVRFDNEGVRSVPV